MTCRTIQGTPTKLSRRMGKSEQARDHLTTAVTMYREMDMRFWLQKAEAELGVR